MLKFQRFLPNCSNLPNLLKTCYDSSLVLQYAYMIRKYTRSLPLKKIKHEKEFDTMTLVTNTKETLDRKTMAEAQIDVSENQPTQIYEPRPLTPEDDIYEDIIEQFASAPTMPKYWFEEFGDYWSCSCGHINRGDFCKSCGLERELLRSLFILHKPDNAAGNLNKKLKKSREQVDKEAEQYAQKESRRKEREASGEDLTKVVPIETDSQENNESPKTSLVVTESNKSSLVVVDGEKHKKDNKKVKIIIAIIVCLILVGIGGFAIYKHLAAPAMQYEEAIQLQQDGKYEEAIEKFTALGDYKDSQELIWQCWILLGDSYYDSGEFKKAIETYETALSLKEDQDIYNKIRKCHIKIGDKYYKNGEYEKALASYSVAAETAPSEKLQERVNDAMFGYVKKYKSDRTSKVEDYMDELMDMNYPGIKEIYDEYYAWHVSIIANKSEEDFSNDISNFSRKDTVYFHATLSGGEPSEVIRLYYEVTWPDGHKELYDLDSNWQAGDKLTARFQYSIPLFGREGKLSFTLYDANTSETLGSDSVTFKH